MKILKRIAILAVIALACFGGYMAYQYYTSWMEQKVKEESEVLLEKVKTVCKLVTVEGHYSNFVDFESYWGYDWSIFRKKALVRVQGRVSIGYDLTNLKLEARPEDKTVLVSNLPDPTIINIEHELDYYDLKEGMFNSFTQEELNRINRIAKDKIIEEARSSDLFLTAEKQANQMLDLLKFIVESAGWELRFTARNSIDQTVTDIMN